MLFPSIETGTAMNARESENYLPIHAHSVLQNSVEIFWAEIYRGRLLTLTTGSSSRLLRIQFSADLTMYWFPVCHFRCMKFKPLVIWIWNQNIAISTIVGTSSHITYRWNIVGILFMCVCQWAINPTVLSVLKKTILKLIRLTNL